MAVTGIVRQPRAFFNGLSILECEVVLTRYAQASTFVVKMALDAPDNPGAAYWANSTNLSATVTGENGDGSGSQTLIDGTVDNVQIEFETRTVTVSGRNAIGKMADARSDAKKDNHTPEQIVQKIAGKYGLGFQSNGGGSGMAGKTFDHQTYTYGSDWQTDWDVVQQMAQIAGKQAYVVKNTLYFESKNSSSGSFAIHYTPPTQESYASSNSVRIHCIRDANNAGGFDGKVGSYPSNDKTPSVGSSSFGGS